MSRPRSPRCSQDRPDVSIRLLLKAFGDCEKEFDQVFGSCPDGDEVSLVPLGAPPGGAPALRVDGPLNTVSSPVCVHV